MHFLTANSASARIRDFDEFSRLFVLGGRPQSGSTRVVNPFVNRQWLNAQQEYLRAASTDSVFIDPLPTKPTSLWLPTACKGAAVDCHFLFRLIISLEQPTAILLRVRGVRGTVLIFGGFV